MKHCIKIICIVIFFSASNLHGEEGGIQKNVQSGSKPLEVRGQSRSLALFKVGVSEKNKIGFVKARKDFRKEIMETRY